LNDWEEDRVPNLLHEIGDFTGTTSAPDSMRWKNKKDGLLSVKWVYVTINTQQNKKLQGLWENVWKNIAPTKVKC